MAAKNVKLLLMENVDSLGIVGDVVNVRLGYARNFLLPRSLATEPSEELMKGLAVKRAEAERQLALLRKAREEETAKLTGIELTLIRSCNDQGHLYASVTQPEIAAALNEQGHTLVKPRDVRLGQVIKRIDSYDVHVKLDSDLDAMIKLWVVADRKLDLRKDEPSEPEPGPADGGEGAEAGEKPSKGKKGGRADAGEKPEGKGDGEKPARKADTKGEKGDKSEKSDKVGKGDKKDAKAKK
jgi:large subunit ribosomal protein L9